MTDYFHQVVYALAYISLGSFVAVYYWDAFFCHAPEGRDSAREVSSLQSFVYAITQNFPTFFWGA